MVGVPVTERLLTAMNAHDIEGFVECFAPDYESEQPAHPDRAFRGRDQVHTNWSSIFRDVPDLRGELLRESSSDGEEWGEWRIHGTRRDGTPMEMRGVIINGIREGRIASARLYLELVEDDGAGIAAAVEDITRGNQVP
jgi:ketosteroid isomerase-like protein